MKRPADWDPNDTEEGLPDCGQDNGEHLFPQLFASACHADTPLVKYMALYETFKLITLNEIGVTLADSMFKLIGSILGTLGKDWWPLSLAGLEKMVNFKGLSDLYRSEHFCPNCHQRFVPPLEQAAYLDNVDQVCSKDGCGGMRFAKVRNGLQEVKRAIPQQQCYYYRLERVLEKAENDQEFQEVLENEAAKRQFVMSLRSCK